MGFMIKDNPAIPSSPQVSPRVRKILKENPQYSKLNFEQLKKKGVFLKYQKDSDRDGVKNIKDCQPLNKKRHQIALIAPAVQVEKMEKQIRGVRDKIKEKIHRHKLEVEGKRRALAITQEKEAKHTQEKLNIERDIAKSKAIKEKAQAELKELHKGKFRKFLEKPETKKGFKRIGKKLGF